jgi:nucleotide-binding universal stress UspA family protein
MFKQILVPLDGSKRAEQALPVAARIARTSGGSVVLLQVVGLGLEYSPYLAQAGYLTQSVLEGELARAKDYLMQVVYSEALLGIKTEIEAIPGLAAQTILTYAQLRKVDLVVICSHGYSGFKRWALGSVAQKLARHSPMPMLVLREDSPEPLISDSSSPHPLRALVALDGSQFAEAALAPAARLVAALSAPEQGTVHLTQVLKLPAVPDGLHYKQSALERREQAAHEAATYLSTQAEDLSNGLAAELGLQVTWSVAMNEDVAETLIKEAELGEVAETHEPYDLIAMATHGRGGIQRWMIGSITERVLEGTKLPLLVVRPQDQTPL